MFNQEDFRPFLEPFLKEKVLYRLLMGAKIPPERKGIYARKIYVFE